MRKQRLFLLSTINIILVVTFFGSVSANPINNSKDVVEKFKSAEKIFLNDLAKSEWVHVNAFTELHDASTVQMENWYHLEDGLAFEVFEWTTINNGENENFQEGMLKDGVWFNITFMDKQLASSQQLQLDLTSGFGRKLLASSNEGRLIGYKETCYSGESAYMFSYFAEDDISKGIESYERRIYLEKSSGRPLGSEIYQNNTDGSIVLIKTAVFNIELDSNPPEKKLVEMQETVEEKSFSFQWIDGFEETTKSKTWYQTSYRSENVVVSGLSVKSYKNAIPLDVFWKGNMYTGTPDTILQEAGANWFSFQERCGSSIYNTYISTTPDIVSGRAHWFTATGIAYYYFDDCASDHKVFTNGSHYAKYNFTIMNPSPDFTIWMPVP